MSYEVWGEPDESPFEAAIEAGWIDPDDLSVAMRDVIDERERQETTEGWTAEHDDRHGNGEMAAAAAAYALHDIQGGWFRKWHGTIWPWSAEWWKPKDRRRDLVRAAALIVAEIERLDRRAASSGGSSPA